MEKKLVSKDELSSVTRQVPIGMSHGVLFSGSRFTCIDEAVALMNGDQLIALATISSRGEEYTGVPSIVGVWVDPGHRRQGYGSKVLQAAVERCIERGLVPVRIDALAESIKLIVASFNEELRQHVDLRCFCMPGLMLLPD